MGLGANARGGHSSGWLPLSHLQAKKPAEIAVVFVRFDHVASIILNAGQLFGHNHDIGVAVFATLSHRPTQTAV
jgi:hypothetical protein